MIRPPKCRTCGTEDYYRTRSLIVRGEDAHSWIVYCRHCGAHVNEGRRLFQGTLGGQEPVMPAGSRLRAAWT